MGREYLQDLYLQTWLKTRQASGRGSRILAKTRLARQVAGRERLEHRQDLDWHTLWAVQGVVIKRRGNGIGFSQGLTRLAMALLFLQRLGCQRFGLHKDMVGWAGDINLLILSSNGALPHRFQVRRL